MKTMKSDPNVHLTEVLLRSLRVFFIFVLSSYFVADYSIAQTYKHPIFDSLKIIPANPSPNDNVRIICYTNLSTSPAYLDSSKVSNQNNQIDLDLYYLIGNFMANSIRVDTIDLGFLNSGNYSLGAYAYSYLTEHPNFNSDTAYINFKVAVYDIHGRLIKQMYEGKPSTKQIELKVNTSSFANGIYFYHVLLGKHSENIKFIKN